MENSGCVTTGKTVAVTDEKVLLPLLYNVSLNSKYNLSLHPLWKMTPLDHLVEKYS